MRNGPHGMGGRGGLLNSLLGPPPSDTGCDSLQGALLKNGLKFSFHLVPWGCLEALQSFVDSLKLDL